MSTLPLITYQKKVFVKKFPDSRHSFMCVCVCVCVCKHGPATYMVTKPKVAHIPQSLNTHTGPWLRLQLFQVHSLTRTLPLRHAHTPPVIGRSPWECRASGLWLDEGRWRAAQATPPTGTAPRTISAGRSSTTEWKREGRERKEEKKEKTCAQLLWIEYWSFERSDTNPNWIPGVFDNRPPELRASASD